MSNDTTEKQIADLREDVAKIIRNQAKLERLIWNIGRHIYSKDGTGVAHFDGLAKTCEVES